MSCSHEPEQTGRFVQIAEWFKNAARFWEGFTEKGKNNTGSAAPVGGDDKKTAAQGNAAMGAGLDGAQLDAAGNNALQADTAQGTQGALQGNALEQQMANTMNVSHEDLTALHKAAIEAGLQSIIAEYQGSQATTDENGAKSPTPPLTGIVTEETTDEESTDSGEENTGEQPPKGPKKDGKGDAEDDDRPKKTKKLFEDVLKQTKIGNKLLEAEEKRKALKSAALAVQENIAQAMKAGFPQNILLMAQAALQGKKIISDIKGQFHGGISSVPSTGTYLLEAGERVLSRDLNGDIKSMLAQTSDHLSRQKNGDSGYAKGVMMTSDRQNVDRSFKPVVHINVKEAMTEESQHTVRQNLKDQLNDLYRDHAMISPFETY